MIRYEDDCVGCKDLGLYCLGLTCPNRNVPHYYCDECGYEETLYNTDFGELCADCLLSKFPKVTEMYG